MRAWLIGSKTHYAYHPYVLRFTHITFDRSSSTMSSKSETMRVLMTQLVPAPAIERLREAVGDDGVLDINPDPDRIWTKQELIDKLRAKSYNALYCLLTNPIDAEVMDAAPGLKIIANMAVG